LFENLAVSYTTYGVTCAVAKWRHLKGKDERMIASRGIKYKDELFDHREIMIKEW
jgi:hypothetical protein